MTTDEWIKQFRSLEFKWYGYEGKEMRLKWMNPPDPIWNNVWLPVKVLKEYPKWLLVEIQPHINPNHSFGMSKPYRLGVNKIPLMLGEYKLKEYNY